MPPTKRGVYHNLKESKYTTSNSEVVFFFSSELYMKKFLDGYQENREKFVSVFNKGVYSPLNMNTLADIRFYKDIEKRGFRACLKGLDVCWEYLHTYALRKMTDSVTLEWQQIDRPKIIDRVKEF